MKPWIFLVAWVVFWLTLGKILDKRAGFTLDAFGWPCMSNGGEFCLIVAISGGGTLFIYSVLDGFIRFMMGV